MRIAILQEPTNLLIEDRTKTYCSMHGYAYMKGSNELIVLMSSFDYVMFLKGTCMIVNLSQKLENIVATLDGGVMIYVCEDVNLSIDVIIYNMSHPFRDTFFVQMLSSKDMLKVGKSCIQYIKRSVFNLKGNYIVNFKGFHLTYDLIDEFLLVKDQYICHPVELFSGLNHCNFNTIMFDPSLTYADSVRYIIIITSNKGCKLHLKVHKYDVDIVFSKHFTCISKNVFNQFKTNCADLKEILLKVRGNSTHYSVYEETQDNMTDAEYCRFYCIQPNAPKTYLSLNAKKQFEKFRFNVTGVFKSIHGLGSLSRIILTGLQTKTHEISTTIFKNHEHVDLVPFSETSIESWDINIFAINWSEVLGDLHSSLFKLSHKKFNTVLWALETDKCLESVMTLTKYFSKIFTISDYCTQALINSDIDPSKVQTLNIPPEFYDKPTSREKDTSKFFVGCIFDFKSSYDRKNILDTITVFEESISHYENTFLVLKHINSKAQSEDYIKVRQRIESSKCSSRIMEICDHVESVQELYKHFDVYISLHRSEGLGLTIMEALYSGTPVICTAYSGNMDFCNRFNAFLVDYTMIPIPKSDSVYWSAGEEGMMWAQPNIETAKDHLSYIYSNPDEARKRAINYKYFIQNKYNSVRLCKQIYGGLVRFRLHDDTKPKLLIVTQYQGITFTLSKTIEKITPDVNINEFDAIVFIGEHMLTYETIRNSLSYMDTFKSTGIISTSDSVIPAEAYSDRAEFDMILYDNYKPVKLASDTFICRPWCMSPAEAYSQKLDVCEVSRFGDIIPIKTYS